MLIDTGANVMSVTRDFANELLSRGEAYPSVGGQVILADGSTRSSDQIVIRRVTLGNHTLSDVPAMVSPNGSDFLMPFTVLSKIGKFTIDAANGRLIFN